MDPEKNRTLAVVMPDDTYAVLKSSGLFEQLEEKGVEFLYAQKMDDLNVLRYGPIGILWNPTTSTPPILGLKFLQDVTRKYPRIPVLLMANANLYLGMTVVLKKNEIEIRGPLDPIQRVSDFTKQVMELIGGQD